ncbi:MAG: adenine phosphoribosyltransferase [Candidatus Gracilibacteria bacterium]|nr:adenine phosphoribosyltransferase [Candidatus Gracilibacteria bacterium]
MDFKKYIREVKDFPKEGIDFKDITTLLQEPKVFSKVIDKISKNISDADVIIGLDARGFLFAGALAYKLGKPLVIVRKKGKLPYETISVDYELEYGKNTFDLNIDAVEKGQKVAIIDDLLATGGTALAACQLVEKLGGEIHSLNFLIDLTFIDRKDILKGYKINSLCEY